MDRPDNTHRLQVLRDGGRVTIPVRRGKLFLALFGSIVFTAVGFGMIVLAVSAIPRIGPVALLSKAFIIGVLAVLVFGCWFMTSAVRQLLRPQRLIVRPEGLEFETRNDGKVGVGLVTWTEIVSFFGQRVGGRWPFRGTLLCCYRLTSAAAARRPAPTGRFARWIQNANANLMGPGVVALPTSVGSAETLLEFLIAAHRQQLGRPSFDRP